MQTKPTYYTDPTTGQRVEITRLPFIMPKWATDPPPLTVQPAWLRMNKSKENDWAKWKSTKDNTPQHLKDAYAESKRRRWERAKAEETEWIEMQREMKQAAHDQAAHLTEGEDQ